MLLKTSRVSSLTGSFLIVRFGILLSGKLEMERVQAAEDKAGNMGIIVGGAKANIFEPT